MTRIHISCAATVLALSLLPLAAREADAQQVIWRGRSGGYDVTWSDRDISARRASDGAVVFSARRLADAEWAEMDTDPADTPSVREYERKVRLLSVVGSVISLEEATYCDCGGAHPISWTRFIAYDLARSTAARPHAVSAGDLVPETDLLRALAADRLIQQAMRGAGLRALPPLARVGKALQGQDIQPAGEECTYGVGEQFPTAFAAHHVENGRVALRFSLSHAVEVCRGMMIQVGVLVPPRARVMADLNAAAARRAGFLTKDLRTIAGDRGSVFNYKPRRRGGR